MAWVPCPCIHGHAERGRNSKEMDRKGACLRVRKHGTQMRVKAKAMSTTTEWTLRSDLELFGIKLPERFDLEEWAASLRNKPAQATAIFASAAAVVFYLAERGHNPKVNNYYDALVYCTTNLSVGYADIFARTSL